MLYAAASSTNPLIPSTTELVFGGIAFVVVFFALGRVLLPRIQKTLQERTEQIEGGLERAEQAQQEAQRTLDQYRAQLADARHEAAQIREEAREDAARISADLRERGEAEYRRLVEAAQAQIEAERAQAIRSLRAEVGALAVDLASRVVGESLTDEARQRRVVDRFLAELDQQPQAAGRQ